MKHQLHPCLWFDGQAKAAADLYCAAFKNSKITTDTPMVVNFELNGQKFMGLNGGPQFKINPAISFFVTCETEEETDAAWQTLSEGGAILMPLNKYPWSEKYGWLQDRFGVSWQIALGKLTDVQGQKFAPFLLFVGQQCGRAEEAVNFYTGLFSNSSVTGISKNGPGENDPEGTVKHAQFNLNGYVMMAIDSSAAHKFQFNEAVSLFISCDNQQEIDYFWDRLTANGGSEGQCGWLKDKFGVSWQVVPSVLGKLMSDPEKGQRVVQAFLKMKKFDIAALENA